MNFTMEEMNLLAIYVSGSKTQVAEDIKAALPDVHDPDMLEIMHSTLAKLENMADADFAALDIMLEDDNEETEE